MIPEYVYVEVIDAGQEAVWQALTAAEFTRQYWHSTRVSSNFTVGSTIQFIVDGAEGQEVVACEGEILSASQPDELSYSWRFPGNSAVADEPPSRVTFRLETISNASGASATRLTVIHDQFPADSSMPEMIGPGWPLVLAGLKTLLETGRARDYSDMS